MASHCRQALSPSPHSMISHFMRLFQNLQRLESTNQDLPMNFISSKLGLPRGFGLLVSLAVWWASVVSTQAQLPFAPPTSPMAQRNALNLLLNQVNWFQNASRSGSSYPDGGYGLLVHQFQAVRDQYNASSTFVMGISHNKESLVCQRQSRAWQSDTRRSGSREPCVWWRRTSC